MCPFPNQSMAGVGTNHDSLQVLLGKRVVIQSHLLHCAKHFIIVRSVILHCASAGAGAEMVWVLKLRFWKKNLSAVMVDILLMEVLFHRPPHLLSGCFKSSHAFTTVQNTGWSRPHACPPLSNSQQNRGIFRHCLELTYFQQQDMQKTTW